MELAGSDSDVHVVDAPEWPATFSLAARLDPLIEPIAPNSGKRKRQALGKAAGNSGKL